MTRHLFQKTKYNFLIVAVLFTIACKSSDQKPEKDVTNPEELKSQVMFAVEEMTAALEKSNLEAYTSRMSNDYIQFGFSDTLRFMDKKSTTRMISYLVKNSDKIQREILDSKVLISDNTAVVNFYFKDDSRLNGQPLQCMGKAIRVFQRSNDQWMLIFADDDVQEWISPKPGTGNQLPNSEDS